jgi:hypothetical protein
MASSIAPFEKLVFADHDKAQAGLLRLCANIGPRHDRDVVAAPLELAPERCHRIQMPGQLRANQAEVSHKRRA